MSLESVFRLSLIMNMIDNLTGPMAGVTSSVNGTVSKLQKANAAPVSYTHLRAHET